MIYDAGRLSNLIFHNNIGILLEIFFANLTYFFNEYLPNKNGISSVDYISFFRIDGSDRRKPDQ